MGRKGVGGYRGVTYGEKGGRGYRGVTYGERGVWGALIWKENIAPGRGSYHRCVW